MKTVKKINKSQLAEAVTSAVKKVILESSHFTAMRQIEHAAADTSMQFEQNIVKALGLVNPDSMPPEAQQSYYQIVTKMKDGIKSSVMDAAKALAAFPKENENNQK